jgi:hypothetical protein
MIFCRIDLSKTDYQEYPCDISIGYRDYFSDIYYKYCEYKKFESVMPLFPQDFSQHGATIFTFYDGERPAAWSLTRDLGDGVNAESIQFAWDYQTPELRLGIRSLEHECAYYKSLGYRYLYLGETADYKRQFAGYEKLGPASNLQRTTSS